MFASNVAPKRRVLPPRKSEPWTCKCESEQHPAVKRCLTCLSVRP